MKLQITIILILLSTLTQAQEVMPNKTPDTASKSFGPYSPFERKTYMLTLSAGISDWNKQNYKLPQGYTNGSTSGFAPIYFKVERAVSSNISIAINLMYDPFYYNYAQMTSGNGASFLRYERDNVSAFSAGVVGYYHFTKLIRVPNLDVFLGVGGTINHIKHSQYPQADSAVAYIDHTVSPHLKVGGRYYLNKYISIFGDVGYDQISIASLGLSCRFY